MEIPCLHLGILPHKNINAVVDIVEKYFPESPFWAQLPNFAPIEGQFLQYLSQIPGIKNDLLKKRHYLDTTSYLYKTRSLEILKDYEELSLSVLKKYRPNSVFFDNFLRIIENNKPEYAKGQIFGPLSIGLLLTDEKGVPVIENGKCMDIIIKALCLQIISQICEMKSVLPSVNPYIFVEEPEISKIFASEKPIYSRKKTLSILKMVAKAIKDNGGIPVFHSNHCMDWSLPIDAGFEVLSFNAESEFVTLLNSNIKLDKYLNAGKKLAWFIMPTDKEELLHTNIYNLFSRYLESLNRMKDFYKVHKSLILNNSIVTVGMDSSSFTEATSEKSIVLGRALADRIAQEAAQIDES